MTAYWVWTGFKWNRVYKTPCMGCGSMTLVGEGYEPAMCRRCF